MKPEKKIEVLTKLVRDGERILKSDRLPEKLRQSLTKTYESVRQDLDKIQKQTAN